MSERKKNSQHHGPGYVYAAKNPDYPDDTKPGLTMNPVERNRGHNRDTMSTPNLKYTILKRVPDMKAAEDKILDFFWGTKYYLSESREILRGVPHEKLKAMFDLLEGEYIPESDFDKVPPIRPEPEPEVVVESEGYDSSEEKPHEGLLLQIIRQDLEWYGTVNASGGIDCQTTDKTYDSVLKWNIAHAVTTGNLKANPSTYDAIRYQDADGVWKTYRKRGNKS